MHIPPVVDDAIKVTRKLGFRYLWVDRYCIPQIDGSEKHNQIRSMDRIYGNAFLTIIAVGGQDPYFGLAGLDERPRTPKTTVIVGQCTLSSCPPAPFMDIAMSRWASRAWTYQEALLSPRRLVFTEFQVYFECQRAQYSELPRCATYQSASPLEEKAFGNIVHTTMSHTILERISEYSKRSLTYDSDILNGLQGIFRRFERIFNPVFQYWGVPLLPPEAAKEYWDDERLYSHSECVRPRNFPEDTITWTPSAQLLSGLLWTAEKLGKRRQGFPSWSWAGWTCPVSYSRDIFLGFSMLGISFAIEDKDGRLISWDRITRQTGMLNMPVDQKNQYLHVTGWQTRMKFEHFPVGLPGEGGRFDESGFFARICKVSDTGNEVAYSHLKLAPDTDRMTISDMTSLVWDCLVLGDLEVEEESGLGRRQFERDADNTGRRGPPALLLAPKEDHFERLGWFEFAPVDFAAPEEWYTEDAERLHRSTSTQLYSWDFEAVKTTIKLG